MAEKKKSKSIWDMKIVRRALLDSLVKLDPRDYEVALAKAQADLGDAEAALESSRIDVPITTTNTASQLKAATSSRADATAFVLGSERQLTAARARLESAQAQVREAEANLKNSEVNLSYTKIISPVDGIVIERKVDHHAVATPCMKHRILAEFETRDDAMFAAAAAALDRMLRHETMIALISHVGNG